MMHDTNSVLQQILKNTYTANDAYRRLSSLRECVEDALYTESGLSFKEECEQYFDAMENGHDARAIRAWGADVLSSFTRDNVSEKIKALHEALEDLPLMTLYIPVEFPDEEMNELGHWFRKQVHEEALLDVQIDAATVGGCAFVWDDTYHDLSFGARMKEQSGFITNILEGYAKK